MAFHKPAPRGWAAIAVLLAWAASLTWLGLRQFGRPDDDALSGEASLSLAPGDAWLSVMAGSVQVGTAGITLDTLSPGFRILESSTLELPQDTGLMHSARFTRIVVGPTLGLQELGTAWSRPGRRTDMSITEGGEELMAHFPPDARLHAFRSTEPFTLMHIVPYQLALAKGLAKNRELKVMLVEGWPASARMSRIWIGSDTVVTYPDSIHIDGPTGQWKAVTSFSSPGVILTIDGVNGPYRVTIDKRGRIQGLETLVGIRWVRGSFETSMNAFRQSIASHAAQIRGAYPTVRALAGIKPIPDSNIMRRFIVSHRDGSPLAPGLLKLLAGGRQQVNGDTLTILPLGAAQSHAEPAIGTEPPDVDPLIPTSVNLSGWTWPKDYQRLILSVHDRVSVDTAATAPEDGRIALETGHGRPDAVARLFVAAARDSNLTARYVIGVRPEGDVLYTHAWVEILNSRGDWLAVDPVMGRTEASTSLIRLGWGGSSYPEDMLPMIANARFTPVPPRSIP